MTPSASSPAAASPAALHRFEPGGYAFVEGNFRYSQGIIALPDHRLRRVRFAKPVPMAEGFATIAKHLADAKRPLTAVAAFELRCSRQYGLADFDEFNRAYGKTLGEWGLQQGKLNPVARSNVAPQYDPPGEQSIHAFTYTVPGTSGTTAEFVVAGSGEWPETEPFPDAIIAPGDAGPEGMQRKAKFVMDAMRSRVTALGGDWAAITTSNVYTVHEFHGIIATLLGPSGLVNANLVWQVCRPPIEGLDFEMDLRCVREELVI